MQQNFCSVHVGAAGAVCKAPQAPYVWRRRRRILLFHNGKSIFGLSSVAPAMMGDVSARRNKNMAPQRSNTNVGPTTAFVCNTTVYTSSAQYQALVAELVFPSGYKLGLPTKKWRGETPPRATSVTWEQKMLKSI